MYFAQGEAHARKGEHLLAAQAFARIQDAFPDDSLAPEALYQEGREYRKRWSKPALDPQYGQTALATFRQMQQLYPEAPRAARPSMRSTLGGRRRPKRASREMRAPLSGTMTSMKTLKGWRLA